MSGEHDFVTDATCKDRTKEILSAIRGLECRLYKDNGSLSIQTRLDRLTNAHAALSKVVWLIVGAGVTSAVGAVAAWIVR